MANAQRTDFLGRPNWTAAKGAQTFDSKMRVLYVNMTQDSADWLAIDVGDIYGQIDDVREVLRLLIDELRAQDLVFFDDRLNEII